MPNEVQSNQNLEISKANKIEDESTINKSQKSDEKEANSQDVPSEPPSERPVDTGVPYSAFTPAQKKGIVFIGAFGAVFSPMSTTIYLPALNTLAAELHVSNAKINLTVTTFLILQGIAPTLVAGFSDTLGRRPAYIACFVIYLFANIGLALQTSYAALMVLRCLQSAGSSGTVALAYGITADVVTSAERGMYIGFTSVPSIVGPVVGPILGGVIAQYLGWRWIFWFLTITSGTYLLGFALFFPETCRKVVGDGSLIPPPANRTLISLFRHRHERRIAPKSTDQTKKSSASPPETTISATSRSKTFSAIRKHNPVASTFNVISTKGSSLILFCGGLVVAALYAINTGIPYVYGRVYKLSDLHIGFVFIPFGAGSIISAFTTGKMIDWNWRRLCAIHGLPVQKNRAQDLSNFPVEKARLQICLPLLYFSACCMVVYGWLLSAPPTPHAVLDHKITIAASLVILFFTGYGVIAAFQILQILMVDLNPGRAAASTAANNLFRCLLGAGSTAIIVPMIDGVGVGGAYTIAAAVWVAVSPGLWWLGKVGRRWRREEREKAARKEEERRKKEEGKCEEQETEPQTSITEKDENGDGGEDKMKLEQQGLHPAADITLSGEDEKV